MAAQTKDRRLDIQGLRAIASLLVASYHIWFGNVSGGVDVFFAIGGYLLAMSLMREVERSGGVHVPKALWRTAQRLFPMALLVLVVVGSVALIASGTLGMDRVMTDIFASATYWENWRLAADATDYVAAGHDKSAFQHFWAMGAQGQFTALCIIAAGLFGLAFKALRLRDARLGFGIVLGVAAVASFVFALVRLSVGPVPTYYDTFARAWELALGGFAALILTRIPLHRIARVVMGLVGLALVLTAGLLPPEWQQPGWVTLYPVAGALLILLAGEGDQRAPVTRLLRIKPLVWVGGISYGLYLWHWPVLKGFVSFFPNAGVEVDLLEGALILALSIGLSYGSYRLIALLHRPRARRGAAAPTPAAEPAEVAPQPGRRGRPVLAYALPVLAAISAIGVVVAPFVQRAAIAEAAAMHPVAADAAELAGWVADAAAVPSAPAPGAVVGPDARSAEWLIDGCLTVGPDEHAQCRFDDSPSDREVWIVGDSQAVTWAPAVRGALGGSADVQLLGRQMCPFSSGPAVERQIGGFTRVCDAHAETVLELAEERRPELVVISYGAWWVGEGYEDRADDTGEQLAAGTLAYAERLHALGIRTLWLDSPPPAIEPAAEPADCLEAHAAGTAPDACAFPLQEAQVRRHVALGDELEAGGVAVVDTISWFCDVDAMTCPSVVQGAPTWVDRTHMGAAAAVMRKQVVADALAPQLND
ncbi:acyltransferase family protein [Agrococcus sp. DT81.2]|uniref:acyltransferase family protein n=1 Tax=Agrococcus sp. DT81.2 TaxID=3393414 RepID=UPI003CE4ED7A